MPASCGKSPPAAPVRPVEETTCFSAFMTRSVLWHVGCSISPPTDRAHEQARHREARDAHFSRNGIRNDAARRRADRRPGGRAVGNDHGHFEGFERTSSAPSTQPDRSSQPAQPAQPPAPSQMSPSSGQSSSSTDVRNESRTTERVVETERTKVLGLDPTVATIVGAVLLVIVILAIVVLSSETTTTTTVDPTRRTL